MIKTVRALQTSSKCFSKRQLEIVSSSTIGGRVSEGLFINNSCSKFTTKKMSTDLSTRSFKYPESFRDESALDSYKSKKNGEVTIADPYRWLEEPNGSKTKEWVNAQ